MTLTFQWTDDDAILQTWVVYAETCEMRISAESKEIPIRGKAPRYIPLGFTGPEITITFTVTTTTYPTIATLHPDLIITVSTADSVYFPEFPLASTWHVTNITDSQSQGQFYSSKCELKIVRIYP